jgi:hypothetical protein
MSSLEVLPTSLASAETRAFATFLLRGPRGSASRCQCTGLLIGAGSSSAHRFRALSRDCGCLSARVRTRDPAGPRRAVRVQMPAGARPAPGTPDPDAGAHPDPACHHADRGPTAGSLRQRIARPRCAAGRTWRRGSGSPRKCAAALPASSLPNTSPLGRSECQALCQCAIRSTGLRAARSDPHGRWPGTTGSPVRRPARPARPRRRRSRC